MLRLIFLTSIVLSGLILFACNDELPLQNALNAKAETFLDTNYDSTIYYANQNITTGINTDTHFYSYYLIAFSYEKKKFYSNALSNYLEALNVIPDNNKYDGYRYGILNNLGKIFNIYSNHELAIKHYRQALDYVSDENRAALLYNLGNAYKSSGQYEKATKTYLDSKQIAIQQNDELRQAQLHHKLGLLYLALDDVENAKSYFKTIVNYSANESASYQKYVGKALHNIGEIYLRSDDYTTAIQYFEKALTVKSGTEKFITYMDLGTCYHNTNQSAKAIASFKEAEKMYATVTPYKKYIDLFKHMHRMYREQGNMEASTAAVESYFAAIDQYDRVKEEQIALFSAAEMNHVVSNFNDRMAFRQTLEDYKYLILALAVLLLAVIVLAIRMLRSYLHAKRKKESVVNAGKEFFKGVESLLNDV